MNCATLTQIKQLPKAEEVSQLRSPRDSQTGLHAWKREVQIVKGLNDTMAVVNQLSREMKRLGERKVLDLDLFPFKIYNPPDEFQNIVSSSIDNWHMVNIRGGYVFTSTFDTGSVWVNGTDRMEPLAYQNFLPNPISTGQYVVPIGSNQYWFWVETSGSYLSGSPYFIRASSTPQTSDNLYNPNGWTNWPSASISSSNYIIGWVSASYPNITTRQIQVGDILASGTTPNLLVNVCNNGVVEQWKIVGYKVSGSA